MNAAPYSEITICNLLQEMGDCISFVEVGVLRASTLVYLADHCENLSSIVGIDSYEPYIDALHPQSMYSVNASLSKLNKNIAEEKIRKCSKPEIITLLILDCIEAAKKFKDKSIDCVFLDAYMNEEQVCSHIKIWKQKVKTGGILLGHDIHTPAVISGLEKCNINYIELDNNIWMHKI